MALDQVKTQVLLLHSEQSRLDSLSQGFDDRYTVHCATTGTEALVTLGDTPIHVIISAKDLPGMSGVEALREAKKRSPDTIGILLAGPDDKGLEALVGDKEVFQVVRGGISADDLSKLIDDTTQQMRLMALAESANDTAANPDVLTGEHIVMETSDNGSTIISDGTGTLPALDPKKISASAAAGARAVDVLVLTKDEEFLSTVRESTRGLHNVRYANTLAQAEEALAQHKVGVAVVDAALVGPNVEKLTQHLRKKRNRLVNIVAGRRDDGEMLMDLINRGKVYRFLLKPVSPGRARLAIEASVKHHLEAPDAAFNTKTAPASTSTTGSRPALAAKAAPKPSAGAAKIHRKLSTKPTAQTVETSNPAGSGTPANDPLSTAFDEEQSGFAATMTNIVETVSKTFGKDDQPDTLESAMSVTSAERIAAPSQPLPDIDDEGGSRIPKALAFGGAALAVVAAIGFWLFSGSEQSPPVDPAPEPDAAVRGTVNPSAVNPGAVNPDTMNERQPRVDEAPFEAALPDVSADDLLDEARLARGAGQIFNPPESNALELYAAAAAADPADEVIQAEYSAIIDQTFAIAEQALMERRHDEAGAALDRVALVDPSNARLPFLIAQLEQMQLREAIESARLAIRESRFEDAANSIAAATALNPADTSELDTVRDELAAARSAQQVDQVLAQARIKLDEGSLISPANDNARYYYELVLASDPENLAAQQGLVAIASKLVLQARAEIDRGRFDRAQGLLTEAGRIDPESTEVAAASGALNDAQARLAAEQQRQAQARAAAERAEAERIAAEQRAQAEAEQARLAAEADAAETAAGDTESIDTSTGVPVADAGSDADPALSVSSNTAENPDAAAVPVIQQPPVAVSSLSRTRYVAPKYPRSAERRNLSGLCRRPVHRHTRRYDPRHRSSQIGTRRYFRQRCRPRHRTLGVRADNRRRCCGGKTRRCAHDVCDRVNQAQQGLLA